MLLSLHQQTRDSLERNTQENSRLAGDIASAVMGLQFQDRVKQRVEHVVEALESVERVLAGARQPAAEGSGSGSDLLAGVHSSYTMQAERDAHNLATNLAANQTASQAAEPAEMEVELF
jgi:hypothetical protein